jgi:hypothetical protein
MGDAICVLLEVFSKRPAFGRARSQRKLTRHLRVTSANLAVTVTARRHGGGSMDAAARAINNVVDLSSQLPGGAIVVDETKGLATIRALVSRRFPAPAPTSARTVTSHT